MVDDVTVDADGYVTARLLLTIAGCPLRQKITADATAALAAVPGVTGVAIDLGVMTPEQRAELRRRLRGADPGHIPFSREDSLTKVYAVASGKGGVGKSSVTVNLACALATRGLNVGIVDADVYGFSVPGLMGLVQEEPGGERVTQQPTRVEEMILPPVTHEVKVISIGMFVTGNQPVAWRGPMLHRALEQLLGDVYFGDLDVLFLDLPPGTGDIAISVGQLLPGSELLIVTTPQPAAANVAERAGSVAGQTRQRVAGVIENMSWLDTNSGERMELFGSGGGAELSRKLGDILGYVTPLLGQVPLDIALRESCDAGLPLVIGQPEAPGAQALSAIADRLFMLPRGLAGRKLDVRPAEADRAPER